MSKFPWSLDSPFTADATPPVTTAAASDDGLTAATMDPYTSIESGGVSYAAPAMTVAATATAYGAPAVPTLGAVTDAVRDGQSVSLTATSTDSNLTKIEWVLDPSGAATVVATDTTSPYAGTWTVTSPTDGSASTLVARAWRGSLSTDSAPVSVFVMPTGMFRWHRADLGVTKDGSNLVSVWADQSGNSRDLSSTSGHQPTWGATSGPSGGNAITFSESGTTWLRESTSTGTHPRTRMGTAKTTVGTTMQRRLTDGGANANFGLIYIATNGTASNAFDSLDQLTVTGWAANTWYTYTAVFNAGSSLHRRNGTQTAGALTNGANHPGITVGSAGADAPGHYWDGPITEILEFNVALSSTAIANVETYMRARP